VRKVLTIILILFFGVSGYYFLSSRAKIIDPRGLSGSSEDSFLQKYDFDSLRKRVPVASEIQILGPIKEVEDRRANLDLKEKYTLPAGRQAFTTREISFESEGQKISGMINYMPERSSLSPVIIMVRGYAEKIGYYPGSGSWRMADELAKQGYATISLDLLGYANSDPESNDMLEARFHKVVEVLDLLESVKRIPWVDKNRIGFWAHSNGGQIVMSVLEITGERFPTVMWAPMTQSFPESVLSTIDEGSPVKEAIEEFEKHYDSRRYAFENYYKWINSPILIQQGTADEWVEVEWQNEVVEEMEELGKNIKLEVIEGADHNMRDPSGLLWKEAVDVMGEWYKRQ